MCANIRLEQFKWESKRLFNFYRYTVGTNSPTQRLGFLFLRHFFSHKSLGISFFMLWKCCGQKWRCWNNPLQTLQNVALSCECFKWYDREVPALNAFVQIKQGNRFSSECNRECVLKRELKLKTLLHLSHFNCFRAALSWWYVQLCTRRLFLCMNVLLQFNSAHLNSLSAPLCSLQWARKLWRRVNGFWQMSHWYFKIWTSWCLLKLSGWVNFFSHNSHLRLGELVEIGKSDVSMMNAWFRLKKRACFPFCQLFGFDPRQDKATRFSCFRRRSTIITCFW